MGVGKAMITDALIVIFGCLISWLLYSKSERDKRFESRLKMYEELSEKLSSLYLEFVNFKNERMEPKEFGENYISTLKFLLVNKFVISETVNDQAFQFLQSLNPETDENHLRDSMNATIQTMQSELGLPVMDKIDKISRIETLIESIGKRFQG